MGDYKNSQETSSREVLAELSKDYQALRARQVG